jgi:SAM-dependent methyltransferase
MQLLNTGGIPAIDNLERRVASLYDLSVPDWPGEIDFYRSMALQASGPVLEVGCGTGRVAVRLADLGFPLVGLDRSAAMLEVARRKSSSIRWIQADMRDFDLGECFHLIIIPGHSFQHMLTEEDQQACLACLSRHLNPGATLIIHLDHQHLPWLAGLPAKPGEHFEPVPDLIDPTTGHRFVVRKSWAYEPATQTATVVSEFQERDERGEAVASWRSEPLRLHCVFRFEMAYALRCAGFEAIEVYGDFARRPLQDDSCEMIWTARRA